MDRLLCVAKALSTPDSLVCLRLFLQGLFFCSNVGGSVSPRSTHQVLVRHVGNVLACFMSAEEQAGAGGAVLPHMLLSRPLDRHIMACC